ncbi:MAG: MBL fold metallo-hydrolase [Gemmatimonadota bacterium]|nr:MBL fold metallo-hydrolase [Gemmatimonadota bacterium]
MIELEAYGDVIRVLMTTRRTRAFGYSVSVYLTRSVLIDTGFPSVAADVSALLEHQRPRGIVLTHHHEDHAGNLPVVARRGLPVATSELTLAAVRQGEIAGLYRRVVWGNMPPFAAPVDAFVPAGLALLHMPGHSADHHVVWDAEREVLFAGDLFLGVRVRAARPGEDPRALARSLRAAAALRPRELFCAHRGRVPDPVATLEAKADWTEATVAAIDGRIAQGWSDAAISREVLGREDVVGYITLGDLSRRNFVRAVRAGGRPPGAASGGSPAA